MAIDARFLHTNLVARDWRALARFYQDVFGCTPVPPERDLSGAELARGTGVANARIRGVHLRLPGSSDDAPTLEIFEYENPAPEVARLVNRPGFGHIAFRVESVPAARDEVLACGGTVVGDIVTMGVSDTMTITWCYVTDPEGNIVELQSVRRRGVFRPGD